MSHVGFACCVSEVYVAGRIAIDLVPKDMVLHPEELGFGCLPKVGIVE